MSLRFLQTAKFTYKICIPLSRSWLEHQFQPPEVQGENPSFWDHGEIQHHPPGKCRVRQGHLPKYWPGLCLRRSYKRFWSWHNWKNGCYASELKILRPRTLSQPFRRPAQDTQDPESHPQNRVSRNGRLAHLRYRSCLGTNLGCGKEGGYFIHVSRNLSAERTNLYSPFLPLPHPTLTKMKTRKKDSTPASPSPITPVSA